MSKTGVSVRARWQIFNRFSTEVLVVLNVVYPVGATLKGPST